MNYGNQGAALNAASAHHLGQRAATTNTSYDQASPNVPAPRTITDNVLDRANVFVDHLVALLSRQTALGDRLFGSVPTDSKGQGGSLAIPGILGTINTRFDEILSLISSLEEATTRLERLA